VPSSSAVSGGMGRDGSDTGWAFDSGTVMGALTGLELELSKPLKHHI